MSLPEDLQANAGEQLEEPHPLRTRDLEAALEETKARAKQARAKARELIAIAEAAEEEEGLLGKLLALRQGGSSQDADAINEEGTRQPFNRKREVKSSDDSHPVVSATISILSEVRQPLPISELMRLLYEQGIEIPGAGTQANLISHLTRDDRVVRPSRGIYALAAWGEEELAYAVERRRPKRVKKRKRVRKV